MEKLYVEQSKINGRGLFIAKALKKGELIDYVHGDIHVFKDISSDISEMMLDWIGVGRHSWIDTSDSMFRFINHSCDPNVAIVTKRKVIAIKNIPANTEITMDYSLTEAEEDWYIDCDCGAKQCRRKIGPISSIPRRTFNKYKQYIPKNFIRIYEYDHRND